MNTNYLSIHFPHWSTERLQSKSAALANKAMVLVERQQGVAKVRRHSKEFVSSIAYASDSLQLAQACLPEVLIKEFEPQHELEDLKKLAIWSLRWAPFCSVDSVRASRDWEALYHRSNLYDGILLDCQGLQRYYKGLDVLVDKLMQRFSQWGLSAKLGFGGTIGSAWAFARFTNNPFSSTSSDWQVKLKSLPIQALRLLPRTISTLQDLGIETIDDICNIPRTEIGSRLGNEILHRLDQLMGKQVERFISIDEEHELLEHTFQESRAYEFPIHKRHLVASETKAILITLLQKLTQHKRRAKTYQLEIFTVNELGTTSKIMRSFSLYLTTNEKDLLSLLTPVIEQINCHDLNYHGHVTNISIRAQATEPYWGEQSYIIPPSQTYVAEATHELEYFLNLLHLRQSGESNYYRTLEENYLPEESFRATNTAPAHSNSIAKRGRPTILFKQPTKIEVIALLPDQPPRMIILNKLRRRIISGLGPERIRHKWWQQQTEETTVCNSKGINQPVINQNLYDYITRDYFTIEDEFGLLWWVFRENHFNTNSKIQHKQVKSSTELSSNWYIHGLWL